MALIYLAGPIENTNHHTNWRTQATHQLNQLGHQTLNPLNPPPPFNKLNPNHQATIKRQTTHHLNTTQPIPPDLLHPIRQTRQLCLHLAAHADLILANLHAPTTGTYEEITTAQPHKPIILITKNPPTWLLTQLQIPEERLHHYIHQTLTQATQAIHHLINEPQLPHQEELLWLRPRLRK